MHTGAVLTPHNHSNCALRVRAQEDSLGMLLKKLTCLLLALVFICSLAVPAALAGETPPPSGGGDIHPWDNNDGHKCSDGPLEAYRRPVILSVGYDFCGGVYSFALTMPSRWLKTSTESSVQVLRTEATPQTVILRTKTNR